MICLGADCSRKVSLAPSLMDRLSSRFSIGNRLARLSTNWGLPDALARLGLADPSAPLYPGPHLGPPHPSPIAEEGGEGQEAGQAAAGRLQSGREQQQKEQQQQQQVSQSCNAREPPQLATGGKRLQRQSRQQLQQSAASNETQLLLNAPLVERGARNDVNGKGKGEGGGDVATARQTAADDGHGDGDAATARQTAAGDGHGDGDAATARQTAADDGRGDRDVGAARQTSAENTGPEVPSSSSSPAGRAALASLGNAQSSRSQSELPRLAQCICLQ